MIKPLIILFNTVSVFLFSFFFGDSPVTVTGNFPKNAKPNTEFVSEITIKKGSVSGFSKLQLEVPQGITVKELESKSGNFSFAGNIAKIICFNCRCVGNRCQNNGFKIFLYQQ
jgi:hypothetical protein